MDLTPNGDQGDTPQLARIPDQTPYEPPAPLAAQPMSYTSSDYTSGRAGYAPPMSPTAGAPFSLEALLRSLFQSYKRVLMHPSVATFDAELPAASWPAIWVGAAIFAVAWTIFALVGNLLNPGLFESAPSIGTDLGVFIAFFIAFFLYVGVYYLIARMFGGRAPFLTFAYAISLVVVPIDLINALAFLIPVMGALVVVAGGLYALYLLVLATQSAQSVNAGRAAAIVLTPVAVSLALSCLLYGALFAFVLVLLHGPH